MGKSIAATILGVYENEFTGPTMLQGYFQQNDAMS